ncbi:deaminase [Parasphingorhabdus sp.]|uniref:deaminase n=1 Tax=Parasphingorhabdus sp. TaxID=2709688 RepID=UPI003A90B178
MASNDREAFLALIAPIGIDMEEVTRVLQEKARQIDYTPNLIKLTDFLKAFDRVPKDFDNEVDRYNTYIEAGDKFCEDAERGDILALLGITSLLKVNEKERESQAKSRRLNIIRQIKRLDEYRTLDRIYGRNIIFLGCYAPKQARVDYLVDRMRVSDRKSTQTQLESQALDIISTDEDETDATFGQKIIDCYPKSDFVLDCTSLKTLESSCDRLVRIYFGDPFVSPSKDEYASYIANAAAYRSLDLSRQVGAAIFSSDGEIISMGCNEVPAPGGGTYWEHHENDTRDYVLGYDSNQRVKEDLARDSLAQLKDQGWLKPSLSKKNLQTLAKEALQEDNKEQGIKSGPWNRSMLTDIIEYGRMVHAEMNAITDAARFNRSTIGTTLYCTTMPCHMCSKLIIASGIKRVVYVQPYVKSLSGELFKDSIIFDSQSEDRRVNFASLKGVTPAGFKRAFARSTKRKNPDGSALKWNKLTAQPTFLTTIPYYINLERDVLAELSQSPIQEIVEALATASQSASKRGK